MSEVEKLLDRETNRIDMKAHVVTPYDHLIGRICITPYDETAGLMLVRSIDWGLSEWMVSGIFIGDHPHGYSHDSPACYHASGVRPTWLEISTFRGELYAGRLSKPEPKS